MSKIGWIRAYAQEFEAVKAGNRKIPWKTRQAEFRSSFSAKIYPEQEESPDELATLKWGENVSLPNGLDESDFTAVKFGDVEGFIKSDEVVEVAFLKRNNSVKKYGRYKMEAKRWGETFNVELLWGDTVQILKRQGSKTEIFARGYFGTIPNSRLTSKPLLEVYFIDVGQGDGVYIRTPDLRHLIIDGGLERTKQQSGKSGADFIDWKFFADYGDYRIRLDSMMASHSDSDHYGGLHDLIRDTVASDRELDCTGCDIAVLHHPGLSRWEKRPEAEPPHREGLGPEKDGFFLRLLEDREDAEASVINGAEHELSGPWKWFFQAALENDDNMKVERVGVMDASLKSGDALPLLWDSAADCSISVLGPVTSEIDGEPALKAVLYNDRIIKSKNTNGHSICLRLDYGKARIMMTGDLNKGSMDWLAENFAGRLEEWKCDVAKACHHGSDDISYKFLEYVNAAATVISSGDAEGHAHPRPEIVGASATSGRKIVDHNTDRLVTPLIYMTEVERSISLGAVNRVDFSDIPTNSGNVSGTILGRHMDEINDRGILRPEGTNGQTVKEAAKAQREKIEALQLEEKMLDESSKATANLTVSTGPVGSRNEIKNIWRSRMMEKLHYGLVNVRTDGDVIMCATMDETEDDWIVHHFKAGVES